MKKITLLLFVLILGCAVNYSFAQEDEDEEVEDKKGVENDFPQPTNKVSKFFVDGRKTMANNVIKFDVTGLIGGSVGLCYERKLSKVISLEALAGITIFNGLNYINLYGDHIGYSPVPVKSNMLAGELKWYPRKTAIDADFYHGLQFYHRSIVYDKTEFYSESEYKINSFRYDLGMQWIVGKQVALTLGGWTGLFFQKTTFKDPDPFFESQLDGVGEDSGIYFRVGIFF